MIYISSPIYSYTNILYIFIPLKNTICKMSINSAMNVIGNYISPTQIISQTFL